MPFSALCRKARAHRWALAAVAALSLVFVASASGAGAAGKAAAPHGTLVWAKSFDIESIDPAHQHEVTGGIVDSVLYDTLTTFSGSKNGAPLPLAAQSWTSSSDQKTFTFHLRHNIKFSDGTPLTSKDVVFSFLRLKNVQGTPAYEMSGLSVSAAGPYTVVITTQVPTPGLPAQVASSYFSITNSKVVQANGGTDAANANTADKAQSYLDSHSAGSGPYTLVSYVRNQSVILKANPNYWGPKPGYAEIVLKNVPASTQLFEVEKGTAQLAVDLAPSQVTNVPSSVRVIRHPSATFFFLDTNASAQVSPVASNKTIDQAIRYAINYKSIAQLAGKGAVQIPGYIPNIIAGALPAKYASKTNLAKAKALVAKSGIKNPTLALEYPDDFFLNGLAFGTIAQRIQSELEAAGITVNLTPGPLTTTLANWRAGKEQLGLWTTTPDYPAPYTYLDFCPGGNHALRVNWVAGDDPALEKLCSQAAAIPLSDTSALDKAFTIVQRKLLAESPVIPLFQPAQVIIASKSVAGIQYSSTTFVDLRTIHPA